MEEAPSRPGDVSRRMRQRLDLEAAPLSDVAAEGEGGGLALMRVRGAAPRVTLAAPDGATFSLAPGVYAFELCLRSEGGVQPRLVCEGLGASARGIALSQAAPHRWSAELELAQTVNQLTLVLDGLQGAFLIAECSVSTEVAEPAPSIRAALLQGARAVFHKSPRWLRAHVSRFFARTPSFSRWRAQAIPPAHAGGQIRTGGGLDAAASAELEARRADFDARFAIARNVREDRTPLDLPSAKDAARVVAFYLPQFHRIPENDAWWGEGFTEWTNVAKAVPQFVGHHQPRLPGELGFYDLTAPDTIRRQVTLAREYGVSAFCFHYYWFAGKRLLERPLDQFLADRSLDLSFTLCWANENWTRRWDGAEDQILIAQQHSRDDHARVFDDMARYLEDPRALRIGGKPLLIVYRPALISDARQMTDLWRERATERGWSGLYLAATDAFQFDDPTRLGFDGLIEFPPHGLVPPRIERRLAWLNTQHQGAVFDYEGTTKDAIARLARRSAAQHDLFPGVMPSWDNEARRPGAGNIFHGATPEAYGRWLAAACEAAARTLPDDRRLVFVNAWNEWAEGAYLEPDQKWGRAFLEATKQVVGRQAG